MGQPASRALADCDQPLQGRPFVCIQGNPVLVHSGTPVLEVVHSPDTQEREDRPTRQSKIDDPLGLLWALLVVPASVQDRVGGIALVERLHGAVKRLKKLWGDSHFDTAVSEAWCRWGWIGVVVRKLVGQVGFVVLPKRWIVERTFGWLNASVGCPRITNAPRPAVKRLSRSPDSSNDPSLETLLIPLFGQTLNMRRIIIVTVTISL